MSTALATRVAEEYAAAAAELPARVVSAARRELAIKTLCAQGLPATRDENWKYANLRALERVRFAPIMDYIWPSGVSARVAEPALMLIDPYPWSAPLEDVRLKK